MNVFVKFSLASLVLVASAQTHAAVYQWTDWTSSNSNNGFTASGTITTTTTSVGVTYNNPQGVAFFQDGIGGETDWWTDSTRVNRDPATSPFTSSVVENIPTGTDMIGLRYAGEQTLTFSEAIANPVFSFISLNANGYGFDQDFEILSYGDGNLAAPEPGGNNCGWWGCGTSSKNVVDLGGGATEYQLLGTGEPHGTIRFLGTFSSLTWRSLTSENWNGFTLGIEGTADEVFPPNAVPVPAAVWLFGTALIGLVGLGKRSKTA